MVHTLALLGQEFDNEILPILRDSSDGKQFIPINSKYSGVGLGLITLKTISYVARAQAVTNMDIQQDIADTVDITSAENFIPVQQDEVIIKRRDWEAYSKYNIPLEADLAQDLAVNIVEEQSRVIIDGWKPKNTYVIKGLFQVAGNEVEADDFSEWGKATKVILSGISKLKKAKVRTQFNVGVATNLYDDLSASTQYGRMESDNIVTILNRGLPVGSQVGQIIECTQLEDDCGFISPVPTQVNKRFFDLIEPVLPKNELTFTQGNVSSGDVQVRQVGAIAPRFKHLNKDTMTDPCICRIKPAVQG